MLELAIFAIALTFAIRSAVKSVGASYRGRMDNWAAEHPDASRIHHRAAALGQFFAMLRYGGPALKHGWKTGWALGWETGKDWAAKHKPIPPAQPEPAQPTPPAQPAQAPTTTPGTPRLRPDGKADLRPVPPAPEESTAVPTGQPTATKGTSDMAIETTNGGEVNSPEQLKAELDAKVTEHAADLEDARADAARATEEVQRTERLAASVKKLKLPEEDIAMVSKLLDPAKTRLDSANQRVRSAELSLAGAQAAQTMAAKHVQLVGHAAGTFYGNGR